MISGQWFKFREKDLRNGKKLIKNSHNSIKNRGGTLLLNTFRMGPPNPVGTGHGNNVDN